MPKSVVDWKRLYIIYVYERRWNKLMHILGHQILNNIKADKSCVQDGAQVATESGSTRGFEKKSRTQLQNYRTQLQKVK